MCEPHYVNLFFVNLEYLANVQSLTLTVSGTCDWIRSTVPLVIQEKLNHEEICRQI